jgi:hypothetical protein
VLNCAPNSALYVPANACRTGKKGTKAINAANAVTKAATRIHLRVINIPCISYLSLAEFSPRPAHRRLSKMPPTITHELTRVKSTHIKFVNYVIYRQLNKKPPSLVAVRRLKCGFPGCRVCFQLKPLLF